MDAFNKALFDKFENDAEWTFKEWEGYLSGGHDHIEDDGHFFEPSTITRYDGAPMHLDEICDVCDKFDGCIEFLTTIRAQLDDASKTLADESIATATECFDRAVDHEVTRAAFDNTKELHERVRKFVVRNVRKVLDDSIRSLAVNIRR